MATTTWLRVPLTTATIGPESWQNATVRNVQRSQKIIARSDKNLSMGRLLDELPSLRDEVAQMSNERAHTYSRQVNRVVLALREETLRTNESIKLLIRSKDRLNVQLERARKDLLLNKKNVHTRTTRPKREKVRCLGVA